jgi:transposase InsO family protein
MRFGVDLGVERGAVNGGNRTEVPRGWGGWENGPMRIDERYRLATDLETGWSELVPVMSKSQREVMAAFVRLHRQLPFPLLGLHIDNGVEFLNAALIGYCRRHQIQLSRGRPFHSNDNPHIEQKNGHLVRRLLSNFRLDSAEQLAWLDKLYAELLRPYNNCFQPVMHAVGRIQVGERSRRLHDTPRTPCSASWPPVWPNSPRSTAWSASTPRSARAVGYLVAGDG